MVDQFPDATPPSVAARTWRFIRRVVVLIVGIPITLAGVVFLVTPGPGIPVVLAGLAILAIEFTWARNRIQDVRRGAQRVVGRTGRAEAAESDPG